MEGPVNFKAGFGQFVTDVKSAQARRFALEFFVVNSFAIDLEDFSIAL